MRYVFVIWKKAQIKYFQNQNTICLFIHKQHGKTKGKRKVQGVPQSKTAALPKHQEEKETDKTKQAQIEQTYEKH